MIEEAITRLVLGLKLFIETVGAIFIGIGCVVGAVAFLPGHWQADYQRLRKHTAAVSSFSFAGSRVSTCRGHTRNRSCTFVGADRKLAAIAVIRTGLNYFLAREMKEEQEAIQGKLA